MCVESGSPGLEVREGVGQAAVQRVGYQPRQRRTQEWQGTEQRRREPRFIHRLGKKIELIGLIPLSYEL